MTCYHMRGGEEARGELDTGVELQTANDPSVFTIMENAPTRAFSCLRLL